MTIVQQGQVNTNALLVSDVLVQIITPQPQLNGVPSNVLGLVGTASWGAVNSPVVGSSPADVARQIGPVQPRKYDLGTAVAAAAQQGANNFRLVRVTDGTDAAATATITCATAALATALASAVNAGQGALRGQSQLVVASASTTTLTLTAKYTGTTGNTIVAAVGPGSAASTTRLILSIALAGNLPEQYDNVGASTSTASSVTLSGGTDGAATITSAVLVGQDTLPRKGMYALRGTGASVAMLCDADDSTQWGAQVSYGASEGTYVVLTGPAGDTLSNAVSAKATAGIDNFNGKMMFGDWVYVNDNVNNQVRLISPQGFAAGKLAALSPEQSTLNKQLLGIVGTQKSFAQQQYSMAELQVLAQAGIDVICNPAPGGNYFACRIGHNASSNIVVHGDNYTRLTNFIAATINTGMGLYLGRVITQRLMAECKATLDNFFFNLAQQGMISNPAGTTPWNVKLDPDNNPQTRTSLGYLQADVQVQYGPILENLLVNVEGGQTVVITRTSTRLTNQ